MQSAPTPDFTFDQHTFASAFEEDILSAADFVFIESAYITVDGVKRFSSSLAEVGRRGVQVCAFVQEPRDWTHMDSPGLDPIRRAELRKFAAGVDLMRDLGAHVTLRRGTHLKLAVFDGKRAWGGSLNILSYTKQTDEEVYLWTDPSWARRMVRQRRLDECERCRANVVRWGSNLLVNIDNTKRGQQIRTLRVQARLTQQQLADRVGVSRTSISNIERGGSTDTHLLLRIFQATDRIVLAMPPQLMPMVSKWISLSD